MSPMIYMETPTPQFIYEWWLWHFNFLNVVSFENSNLDLKDRLQISLLILSEFKQIS